MRIEKDYTINMKRCLKKKSNFLCLSKNKKNKNYKFN